MLGSFAATDKILTIMQSGHYKLLTPDPAAHFEEDMLAIEKFNPRAPITTIYFDAESGEYMVKRFMVEAGDKKVSFVGEAADSWVAFVSTDTFPRAQLEFNRLGKFTRPPEELHLASFIAVKGVKAKGRKLSAHPVKAIHPLASLPEPEQVQETAPQPEPAGDQQKPSIVVDLENEDPQMRLFSEE
jgi:topoisomerase-4 subunit A